MSYDLHYNYVEANPYPQGYIIKYTDLYNHKLNSCILSLGHNRFSHTTSNRVFTSYDEWLETLPPRANGDMGITEVVPNKDVTNGELSYAVWLLMNIH